LKRNKIDHITINNSKIPLKIVFEWRRNTRISINRDKAILRIPSISSKRSTLKQIEDGKRWITEQITLNPSLLERFIISEYKNGQIYIINGDQYIIEIHNDDNNKVSVKKHDNTIHLFYPIKADPFQVNETLKKLLSKLFANFYRKQVNERINTLNEKYFKEEINSIRIKYNKSNWGSCSAKRNINISSRLLFAPKDVQDYIYIHELTHLKELNHSSRFWQIVREVIPDYKEKEKWLKINSHKCDF